MNDLRDRIAQAHIKPIQFTAETTRKIGAAQGQPVALRWEEAAQLTEAVTKVVDEALIEAELTGRAQADEEVTEYRRRLRELETTLRREDDAHEQHTSDAHKLGYQVAYEELKADRAALARATEQHQRREAELAADLDHAERETRRLTTELARAKGET